MTFFLRNRNRRFLARRPFFQCLSNKHAERLGQEWFGDSSNDIREFFSRRGHFMNMAGHHHNRDSGRYFIRSKSPADFVSLDIGQTVVEEDEVWPESLRLFHAMQTGKRGCDLEIRLSKCKRIFDENQQHFSVIDDENVRPSLYRRRHRAWRLGLGDGRSDDGWFTPFRRPERSTQCRSPRSARSEEHTSELQSRFDLVCRLLLEKKNNSQRA